MIPAADRTQSIETIIIIFLSKDAATVRSHTPRPQAQRTKVRTEVTKITGHKKQEQETNGMDKNKKELKGITKRNDGTETTEPKRRDEQKQVVWYQQE